MWCIYCLNSAHQKIVTELLKKSEKTYYKIKPFLWPIARFHDQVVSLDYNYQNL